MSACKVEMITNNFLCCSCWIAVGSCGYPSTDEESHRSVGKVDRTRLVRMTRCRVHASHKTPLPVWEKQFKSTFVSQQTRTAHQSAEMQPQLWNKASLPWETVPLYCHCCSWMSLVISHGGDLNRVDTWAQTGVMITDTLVKHLLPFHKHTHTFTRMQQDRTTKLEGWNSQCMSSLLCISCSQCYR